MSDALETTQYSLHVCQPKLPTDPLRVVEIDVDGTAYLRTEFLSGAVTARSKGVVWKSLVQQADLCFTFTDECCPASMAFHERNYVHDADLEFGLTFLDDIISVMLRLPSGANRAIAAFHDMVDLTPNGYCRRMQALVDMTLAEKSIEKEFATGSHSVI